MRKEREVTLAALSESTGISVSTLSRLESGLRKPSLELLLPIAQAHQVPLDELVGAPRVDDPRVRAEPIVRHGRTHWPLTRQAGGLQAFKVLQPQRSEEPDPRTHEGYEWIYVLSGRLRSAGRARRGAVGGGGRRVRHPGAALVRVDGGGAGRVPQPLRPAGRADARTGAAQPFLKAVTHDCAKAVPRRASDRLVGEGPGAPRIRWSPACRHGRCTRTASRAR
ncbi:hypothetical protein SVIOM342S_00314 [Streptomyces violaceorubidus]